MNKHINATMTNINRHGARKFSAEDTINSNVQYVIKLTHNLRKEKSHNEGRFFFLNQMELQILDLKNY